MHDEVPRLSDDSPPPHAPRGVGPHHVATWAAAPTRRAPTPAETSESRNASTGAAPLALPRSLARCGAIRRVMGEQMRLSTRNQLTGKVTSIPAGHAMAVVKIE